MVPAKKNEEGYYESTLATLQAFNLIKKVIVELVGGCDEKFRVMEDISLSINLIKSNKKFYYYLISTLISVLI